MLEQDFQQALRVALTRELPALRLWRQPGGAGRPLAWLLAGLLLWQTASGLSNVVLGWPIVAALAHSAGAAAQSAMLNASPATDVKFQAIDDQGCEACQ